MTTICVLFASAAVLWLFSLAVCAVAFLCCCFPGQRRFWLAVALSGLAILIGYLGTMQFHVKYSQTVNNSHWSVDSRWFFIVPLLLYALLLALALWRRSRSSRVAAGN